MCFYFNCVSRRTKYSRNLKVFFLVLMVKCLDICIFLASQFWDYLEEMQIVCNMEIKHSCVSFSDIEPYIYVEYLYTKNDYTF